MVKTRGVAVGSASFGLLSLLSTVFFAYNFISQPLNEGGLVVLLLWAVIVGSLSIFALLMGGTVIILNKLNKGDQDIKSRKIAIFGMLSGLASLLLMYPLMQFALA